MHLILSSLRKLLLSELTFQFIFFSCCNLYNSIYFIFESELTSVITYPLYVSCGDLLVVTCNSYFKYIMPSNVRLGKVRKVNYFINLICRYFNDTMINIKLFFYCFFSTLFIHYNIPMAHDILSYIQFYYYT